MPAWICATCGNHYPEADRPPGSCAICSDERQWVPASGQRWTTLTELSTVGHVSDVREVEPGLTGIGADPPVAIGQRALLVQTAEGNLLWDPSGFIDDGAIEAVRDLGGLHAISASHPHFYGAMTQWSLAFGAEILLPATDSHWLARSEAPVRTWSDALQVLPGVTLIQCGGHFPGSVVVHWAGGADGAGALFTGDTIFVTPGEDRLTFVWSAPNRIPLPEAAVRRIVDSVRSYDFDRIYGGWWQPILRSGARAALEASADRYVQFLRGEAKVD